MHGQGPVPKKNVRPLKKQESVKTCKEKEQELASGAVLPVEVERLGFPAGEGMTDAIEEGAFRLPGGHVGQEPVSRGEVRGQIQGRLCEQTGRLDLAGLKQAIRLPKEQRCKAGGTWESAVQLGFVKSIEGGLKRV